MYLLSFSIGQRDVAQAWTYLKVNGENVSSVAAETAATYIEDQGSTTVVIRLQSGDTVWITSRNGDHIEGSVEFRISSFTGVFLFP